ncbi:MAG TPA: decaprenyl-phosphate phosphoribosyltransferase [Planctomycetota bacterium]|nr:decaprenyl-phosphate phosphoribosyltransferase [Planctomycetota bacterium]
MICALAKPPIVAKDLAPMLLPLLQALRPHQWVKNLLVIAPLLFSARVYERGAWIAALAAFATFCGVASAVYLLNDCVDREQDARHPKKRDRPIASGRLSVHRATFAMIVLAAASAVLALWLEGSGRIEPDEVTDRLMPFTAWPAAYLLLNLAYSFKLKRVVVLDCMCVALGFQIRVHAGTAAIRVEASHWLLLCTFFFALFVAFCKRYEEVGRQAEASGQTRATMQDYNLPFLNMMIGPLAALSILTYALYTVSPETIAKHGTARLMYTVPVVTYGVFRYLFLVYRKEQGGDPSRLLFRDPPLLLSGLVYFASVWLVLR